MKLVFFMLTNAVIKVTHLIWKFEKKVLFFSINCVKNWTAKPLSKVQISYAHRRKPRSENETFWQNICYGLRYRKSSTFSFSSNDKYIYHHTLTCKILKLSIHNTTFHVETIVDMINISTSNLVNFFWWNIV
jgi:hypothetical protein